MSRTSPESEKLLRHWLNQGWKFRMQRHSEHMTAHRAEYIQRVEDELELILDKDFGDYFLVVSDIVRWAKDHKIVVGPARGSSGASLICWLLRITEINPMLFPHMMFSRFVDPTRHDLPDIDVDIEDTRRRELWEYAESKYGKECVGNIANVVGYKGKNSLEDVGRAFSIPPWAIDTVKELAVFRSTGDSRADSTLEDTFEMFPAAADLLKQFPDMRYAMDLEGNVRGLGTHAAGMALANNAIEDACALYMIKEGVQTIPYNKKDAEYLGLLKIDLLGLSTLGAISLALNWIGMDMEDLYALPLDDPAVLEVFQETDLTGIFQFEGATTRFICREVAPDHFGHLADINALSRPGPLFSETKTRYVETKHGRAQTSENIEFTKRLHPAIDAITDWTYYQIVYQEQVLSVLRDVGGMPMKDVHAIRRIISQKLGEAQFNLLFDQFAKGAEELHGIDHDLAYRIWRFLATSATYSFVYAHAVAYTIIAYWCAWLKHYYPTEFFAAFLCKVGNDKNSAQKRLAYMMDARRHGIEVLPPDPKLSQANWTPGERCVRAGFTTLPRCGAATAERVLAWRDECGFYDPGEQPDREITWDDLIAVYRVGEKTIDSWKAFAEQEDPFELERTFRIMSALRDALGPGNEYGLPSPTHNSSSIPRQGHHEGIVYVGIPRKKKYGDFLEDEHSRRGETYDEIRARIKDPELTRRCYVECYDDFDEDVRLRFNRWKFPDFADMLEELRCDGTQAVVAVGKKRPDFGVSLHIQEFYIIDLEGE